MSPSTLPTAITIAGSDSGGNAGIQADLLTFAANGVYGTSAITCLTAQNPDGITNIHPIPSAMVLAQIERIAAYYPLRAAKTGMLFNQEIIEAVALFFAQNRELPLVVDPVSVSSSGQALLEPEALDALKAKLLPLATVITPNLDEAELLLGRAVATPEAMEDAAIELASLYDAMVLLKGGHLQNDELVDIACDAEGNLRRFTQSRIKDLDTHGSGCTLCAALAAHLARGASPLDAIAAARSYLRKGMDQPLRFGTRTFINHFPK